MLYAYWKVDGKAYHTIPVMCLMSKRTTNDYNSAFEFINNKLIELGHGKMKTLLVVSDREKALINSINSNIEFVKIKSCLFHISKNVKDQYAKYDLKSELQNCDELKTQFKEWFENFK